jgi:hypothetical protein
MLKRAAQDRLSEEPLRTFLYRLFVDLNYLYTDREIIHTGCNAFQPLAARNFLTSCRYKSG